MRINHVKCDWKHRAYLFLSGFACILDGLVRVLSLGFIMSDAQLTMAREHARRQIDKAKAARQEVSKH